VSGEQARVVRGDRVGVARRLGEVEEGLDRVEVGVEHAQARGEAVEREPHRAAAERHADARGRWERERPGRRARDVQQVGPAELCRRAGERLDRRGLRQRADPWRPSAEDREQVLPREHARPHDAERQQLVEQRDAARVEPRVARAEQRIRLTPRPVDLELQAEAGVVLEHELAPRERDARRARMRREGLAAPAARPVLTRRAGDRRPVHRPPLGVALERQEHGRHACRRQVVALCDLAGDSQRGGHLATAHAAQPVADGARLGEDRAVQGALRGRQRTCPLGSLECGQNGIGRGRGRCRGRQQGGDHEGDQGRGAHRPRQPRSRRGGYPRFVTSLRAGARVDGCRPTPE
jgi:hypothetical protein